MSFWGDVVNDVKLVMLGAAGGESSVLGAAGAQTAATPQQITSDIPLVGTIEGIWTQLTNGKMWRSLGWLLLGVVLMLIGVALWIGPSGARMSPLGVAARELG
jgi:hypothetical protein